MYDVPIFFWRGHSQCTHTYTFMNTCMQILPLWASSKTEPANPWCAYLILILYGTWYYMDVLVMLCIVHPEQVFIFYFFWGSIQSKYWWWDNAIRWRPRMPMSWTKFHSILAHERFLCRPNKMVWRSLRLPLWPMKIGPYRQEQSTGGRAHPVSERDSKGGESTVQASSLQGSISHGEDWRERRGGASEGKERASFAAR